MRFSAFFVWGAEGFQRGASVLPLWSGVGEAPRRVGPKAIIQTCFGAKPSQSFEIIFSIQSLKPAGLENTVAVHYGDLRADHPTLGWVG